VERTTRPDRFRSSGEDERVDPTLRRLEEALQQARQEIGRRHQALTRPAVATGRSMSVDVHPLLQGTQRHARARRPNSHVPREIARRHHAANVTG